MACMNVIETVSCMHTLTCCCLGPLDRDTVSQVGSWRAATAFTSAVATTAKAMSPDVLDLRGELLRRPPSDLTR